MEHLLGIAVPIFGVTGPRYAGKTLLGASLAPGVFPEGHQFAGKHRTLIIDNEGSSVTYNLPADRIDLPTELRQKFGGRATKQVEAFEFFRDFYQRIPAGRYDVVMIDPISDIEGGGTQWVREHPVEFGYTGAQFAKMEAIAIDCAKKMWKQIFLDMSTRCQIFFFTTHERLVWQDGRPVKGQTQAKGMDYLYEASSLYLKLGRKPDEEGKRPEPPFAEVLKSRLAITSVNADGELEICEVLPKRLDKATKAGIMAYVKKPVGARRSGLKPEEIIHEQAMSDDDKLLLQAEISRNNAAAESSKLSVLELAKRAAAALAGGQVVLPDVMQPEEAERPIEVVGALSRLAVSNLKAGKSADDMSSVTQAPAPADQQPQPPVDQSYMLAYPAEVEEVKTLMKGMQDLFPHPAAANLWLSATFGHKGNLALMTKNTVDGARQWLLAEAAKRAMPVHPGPSPNVADRPANEQPEGYRPEPTFVPEESQDTEPAAASPATDAQRTYLRDLTMQHFVTEAPAKHAEFLASKGFAKPADITFAAAAERIEYLEQVLGITPF